MLLTFSTIALLVLFLWFFVLARQIWDVIDTPTVSPSGAIIGLCEIKGNATPPKTPTGNELPALIGPISGYPCVWFEVLVEYYENGKDGGWKYFCKKSSDGGFRIADKYGSIAVVTEGANLQLEKTINENQSSEAIARAYRYFSLYGASDSKLDEKLWSMSPDGNYMWHPNLKQWIPSRYVSPDRKYYYDWVQLKWFEVSPAGKSTLTSWLTNLLGNRWSNSRLRITETAIFPRQDVFVHGFVNVTPDGADLEIGKKKRSNSSSSASASSFNKSTIFSNVFISTKGESKLVRKLKTRKWVIFSVALAISLFVSNVYLPGVIIKYVDENAFVNRPVFKLVVQFAVVAAIFSLGSLWLKMLRTYNRFVRLREQVRSSRSAIDITLKRRTALIPELCDVLEQLTDHEKSVYQNITQLRSLSGDLFSKEILAFAQAYPNIKSSENFIHMQNELGRTEEKIAMARSFLNDSILAMNNLRATVAGMVISPLFSKELYKNV